MRRLFLIVALLIMTVPSSAQTSDFIALLQGKTHPTTLQLKNLTADWRRVSFDPSGGSQGMGNILQMVYSMMGMGNSSAGAKCYTKGDTVEIGGQLFLVTYKVPSKPFDISMFANPEAMKNATQPMALTPDTKLVLTLLNFKGTNGVYNIRAFDLKQEIQESEEESKNAKAVPGLFGGVSTAPSP